MSNYRFQEDINRLCDNVIMEEQEAEVSGSLEHLARQAFTVGLLGKTVQFVLQGGVSVCSWEASRVLILNY